MRKRTRPADPATVEPPDNEQEPEETHELKGLDAAIEDDGQAIEEAALHPLHFREALSWNAGKAIPTGELLKRLQNLAAKLQKLTQETVLKTSLNHVAQELANSNLTRHRDKGVKAWTAHCLVDILILAAPDAPFSGSQLKEIFTLFVVHCIPALANSSDPYFTENQHVLHTLLESQAIVLINDIDGLAKLMVSLFASCFDILSQPREAVNKTLEFELAGLLQSVVEECEELPSEATDTILAQFLRADPGTSSSLADTGKKHGGKMEPDMRQTRLLPKQLPPAYAVAQTICNDALNHMLKPIAQYFGSVMLTATRGRNPSPISRSKTKKRVTSPDIDDESKQGPSKEDLEQLEKAHRLLREMWKACPGVLQSVIPQVEAELEAESADFRKLATQTIGDMISGIGAEATLLPAVLDPVTFPSSSLEGASLGGTNTTDVRASRVTQSFAQTHGPAYQSFLGRRKDKAAEVRVAWTTAIGRILSTSAGSIGLSLQEQQNMVGHLSQMLVDGDDKVRTAAIRALALLDFKSFVAKIGSMPKSADYDPIMKQLADRAREKDGHVRAEASHFLGKLWGVGSDEIASDVGLVVDLLGDIPSKILNGIYANKLEINALIDRTLFESLIPLSYPMQKKKSKRAVAAGELANADTKDTKELTEAEMDRVRVERLLLLYRGLDDRAKKALLAIMGLPAQMSKMMKQFLKLCEQFNGGTMDSNSKETKKTLSKCIEWLSKYFPDQTKFTEDLWTFVNKNDRRCYTLIRFCMAEDSDYRKIYKSIKEIMKRIAEFSSANSTLPETMLSVLYRISNLFYNKSHVSPVIELSCREGHSLKDAAQEVLKDLSVRVPGIFKTHVQELCKHVEENAPNNARTNDASTLAPLKTLAQFARRYPADMPREKKFTQAIKRYALHGSPPSAAKHAVTIIMLSTDKKEMYAKDILKECVDGFRYGSDFFVSKLAALSQLMLLYASDMDEEKEVDPVLQIAIEGVLSRSPSSHDMDSTQFSQDEEARTWALKIIANRLRSYASAASIKEIGAPVYQLLGQLVADTGNSEVKSPASALKTRLRLQAAILLLKLSSHSDFDTLLGPTAFNSLMRIAQDAEYAVRSGFANKVKKYLGQGRLSTRFYCVVYLLAFEPTRKLREESAIWLRARATALGKLKKSSLELGFARFVSVLAHHPDYSEGAEDLEDEIKYLMFYLQNVATADNISLIYHTAQRIKNVKDGIDPSASGRLYYLSELAIAVINAVTASHDWSIRAQSDKVPMPNGIFAPIRDHAESQHIAETQYLMGEAADQVEAIVRAASKSKKRKSDHDPEQPPKKRVASHQSNGANKANSKSATARKSALQKTPSKTARRGRNGADDASQDDDAEEQPRRIGLTTEGASRRKSARGAGQKSYAETRDEEDDAELEEWTADTSPNGNKENMMAVDEAALE